MRHRIYIRCRPGDGPDRAARLQMRRAIRLALDCEGLARPCQLSASFTDEVSIASLNARTRDINRPTDVLSFPDLTLQPGEKPGDDQPSDPVTGRLELGDMVICWPRVCRQAEEYGHSDTRELCYLTVHSVLHLLGYDHLDEGSQKALMRAHEEAIMERLGAL